MTPAAAQARHAFLTRLEQAAGQAFGYAEEPAGGSRLAGAALVTPMAIAFGASALAATISYLV